MALGLGDLISQVGSVVTGKDNTETADKNPISMNAAAEAYGLTGFIKNGGKQKFNLPKLQYAFIVQFVLSDQALLFAQQKYPANTGDIVKNMSYLVRDCDLPSQTYDVHITNQYNRKRVYNGKVQHDPLTMVLYDTIDSGALKLYDSYKMWYYGDFMNKRTSNWEYNQISNTYGFENEEDFTDFLEQDETIKDLYEKSWGRSILQQKDLDQSYFFKRIDIIEIQDGVFTYHNIHNPIITSAKFETKSHEHDGAPAIATITFEHEGSSNINPLKDGSYYTEKAISRPAEELGAMVSTSLLGGDQYHMKSGIPGGLPLDDLEGEEQSGILATIGGIANTALGAVSGVTEGLGIPGLDSTLTNAGNAVNGGLSAVDDATQGLSNAGAVDSIGGLF